MNSSQITIFLELTKRYEDIAQHFPIEMRDGTSAFDRTYKEKRDRLSETVRHAIHRYFNLCSQELFLSTQDLIATSVWALWKKEITLNMQKPLFRDSWQEIRGSYASYPEFQAFIDALTPTTT